MSDKAILTLDGTQYELPIVVGTEGERAVDIRDLRARTGHITLDPGYGNTGSCESAITFIDGERGILRYRGIPIEQLANGPTFVEVAWLLIFGELPTEKESREFCGGADRPSQPGRGDEAPLRGISSLRASDGHPLGDDQRAVLLSSGDSSSWRTGTASAWRSPASSARSEQLRPTPTDTRRVCRHIYPDPKLRYVPNFLHMMFSQPYAAVRLRRDGAGRPQSGPDPPQRPRAELLHLDGAHGGLQRGEPVRLLRRGRVRPVGAAARRGQRGGHRRCSSRSTRASMTPEEYVGPGQGQGQRGSA